MLQQTCDCKSFSSTSHFVGSDSILMSLSVSYKDYCISFVCTQGSTHNSKFHGANMGPIWGRQDPGGPHVGPMNFAIWDGIQSRKKIIRHLHMYISGIRYTWWN